MGARGLLNMCTYIVAPFLPPVQRQRSVNTSMQTSHRLTHHFFVAWRDACLSLATENNYRVLSVTVYCGWSRSGPDPPSRCLDTPLQDLIATDGLYLIRVATDESSTHHLIAAIPAVRFSAQNAGFARSVIEAVHVRAHV